MNHEVMDVRHSRRPVIAATILFISCIAFNAVPGATAITMATTIHPTDYNLVNIGTHPITANMLFPNDTKWTNPDVECLIITNQSFVTAFQPLADLKTSRGVFTTIITIQSIYADSRFNSTGAADTNPHAAYIRNAIKHYHEANKTEFVILGGDVDVIPIRYVHNYDNFQAEDGSEAFPGQYAYIYKPTDHYYACLDGTWDADNDGEFGEMGVVGTSVDEIDWTAEVYVGRFPVNTYQEATDLVQKVIDYETSPPPGSWLNTAVFAGAVSKFDPPVDEAELSEFMIDSYFNAMDNKRLYKVSSSYVPPSPYTNLTTPNLRSAWNLGSSITNLAGHGNPLSFGGETPGYVTYLDQVGASTLSNGGKLPFVYIFSCSSGAFDYHELAGGTDCLSEELVMNTGGGAIAVVSAIRMTYFFTVDPLFEALNEGQNRFFWREFMMNQEYQPGRALYRSQQSYIDQFINKYWNVQLNRDPELAARAGYIAQEEKFRKNLLAYNLLGDPETSIYTNVPSAFGTDVYGQNASIGDTLVLEVTDEGGMPVPNARILLNGSGYYIVARANALGIASVRVPYDPALVGSTMDVTLSGHNMNASRGSILITEDVQAPTSLQVDVPPADVDHRDSLTINASGVDAGSGLRYAFVVMVGETGGLEAIHEMTRARVDGNHTTFTFKYPGALPPGKTLQFYVVAFDASGNYIIATPEQGGYYKVTITSRLVEDVMAAVIVICVPVAIVLILSWFTITRKRRLQRAGAPG